MNSLYGPVPGLDPKIDELNDELNEKIAEVVSETYIITYDAYDGNNQVFENDDIDCVIGQVKILLKGNFRILKIVKKK
jgi:ABC-type Zn2+ transport system substrate-binding protein/surface adhesin